MMFIVRLFVNTCTCIIVYYPVSGISIRAACVTSPCLPQDEEQPYQGDS